MIRILRGGAATIDDLAQKEEKAFDDATVVHVLSTRFYFPDGKDHRNCNDPVKAAREVKEALEAVDQIGKVKVFNPNTDNAFIMGGFEKEANSIWLLNWRKYLSRAQETGGKVVQILVSEPSNMQQAEASMAAYKGVPLVKLHMSGFFDPSDHSEFNTLKKIGAAISAWTPQTLKSITASEMQTLNLVWSREQVHPARGRSFQ